MSREFSLDGTVGLLTIARSDGYCKPSPTIGIFGVSETPFYDPLNPIRSWNYLDQHNSEIAQYARSVRGSNVNQIGTRKYLHAREDQEIILGQNVAPTTYLVHALATRGCAYKISATRKTPNCRPRFLP
ncbi:unnamed protein product [Prunus armeniaca]